MNILLLYEQLQILKLQKAAEVADHDHAEVEPGHLKKHMKHFKASCWTELVPKYKDCKKKANEACDDKVKA